jgi:hypothetical protein
MLVWLLRGSLELATEREPHQEGGQRNRDHRPETDSDKLYGLSESCHSAGAAPYQ